MKGSNMKDFMNEEHMFLDRPKEISPTGTWLEITKMEPTQLPPAVLKTFFEIMGDDVNKCSDCNGTGYVDGELCEICEGSKTSDTRIDFARVEGGAQGVWKLGLHASSPFNPSGYDFFVRTDGSYIGYTRELNHPSKDESISVVWYN